MLKYPFKKECLLMKVDVDLLMLLKMYKFLEMACNFIFFFIFGPGCFPPLCRKVWYDVILLWEHQTISLLKC